jgi:hypothetical protein
LSQLATIRGVLSSDAPNIIGDFHVADINSDPGLGATNIFVFKMSKRNGWGWFLYITSILPLGWLRYYSSR